MGTLQINGNISATGTISAISFLGNASSATKLQIGRTIQINLASTSAASFDGTANITPGITGILPITNGGTGASDRKIAITNLGVFGLYSREDIGTSPNFDNPGVNGLFEMREKTETPGETGTKPFNGYAPFISLRYSNTMFQLAGINGSGFYIRGMQAANPTLTGYAWQKLLTSNNYTDYAAPKSHTHSYLPLSGGTMTGMLNAHGGISLNSSTAQADGALTYILGIKAFADGGDIIWQFANSVNVGYANTSGISNCVQGYYTGSGGAQGPSYIGRAIVKFNMMNAFPGAIDATNYMDCLLMNTYGGGDVPRCTALGIERYTGRAYVVEGSDTSSSWAQGYEIFTTRNLRYGASLPSARQVGEIFLLIS